MVDLFRERERERVGGKRELMYVLGRERERQSSVFCSSCEVLLLHYKNACK
jgi:hypothetical protein